MSLLTRIQRGRTSKPPRIVLFGTEGIGKSTFASQAPSPVFVQVEDGLAEIDCAKFPLAKSFDEVTAALAALHADPHDFETVVIDSLDWMERLIWDALCRQYSVTSIEKVDGGYARGYTHALGQWRQVLDLLNALRDDRGMAVICIAHSKVERVEDPESTAFDRHAPRLHKHACGLVCEWADAVLFAGRKIRVQSEDAGFNRKRGVAFGLGKEGGERVLRCIGGPACVSKNRYGLPEELPLSWAAFMAAMSKSPSQGATPNG
jgi:hypothetical protein